MKIIQYIILISITWGLPSFCLFAFGDYLGSLVSYSTYCLLLVYFFLSKKRRLLLPFLCLGLGYFSFSGLIYIEDSKYFINESIKYFILILCGAEVARETSREELCLFLLLGSLSILFQAVSFADGYGRYSGFYLNPNGAAFVSLIGYCLTFDIKNPKIKYLFIFVFTFTGILTFSRFFFLMWLFITIVSVLGNKKNSQILLIGFASIALLLSLAAILQVNSERFSILQGFLNNNSAASSQVTEDSRVEEWVSYLDTLYDHPFFGNGYKSFSGSGFKQGVHNTYLMVLGESGIFPFLILVFIYLSMFFKSIGVFKTKMYKSMLAMSLLGILMVMHNYLNNEIILFASIWLYVQIKSEEPKEETSIEFHSNTI